MTARAKRGIAAAIWLKASATAAAATRRAMPRAQNRPSGYAGGVAEGWDAPPLNAEADGRAQMDGRPAGRISIHRLASVARRGRWTDGGCHRAISGGHRSKMCGRSQSTSPPLRIRQTSTARWRRPSATRWRTPRPRWLRSTAAPAPIATMIATTSVLRRAISLSLSSAVRQSGSANTVRVMLQGIQSAIRKPRGLHAGLRRHSDRPTNRIGRRICPRAIHRPAAMDRRATGNLPSKTGRS